MAASQHPRRRVKRPEPVPTRRPRAARSAHVPPCVRSFLQVAVSAGSGTSRGLGGRVPVGPPTTRASAPGTRGGLECAVCPVFAATPTV